MEYKLSKKGIISFKQRYLVNFVIYNVLIICIASLYKGDIFINGTHYRLAFLVPFCIIGSIIGFFRVIPKVNDRYSLFYLTVDDNFITIHRHKKTQIQIPVTDITKIEKMWNGDLIIIGSSFSPTVLSGKMNDMPGFMAFFEVRGFVINELPGTFYQRNHYWASLIFAILNVLNFIVPNKIFILYNGILICGILLALLIVRIIVKAAADSKKAKMVSALIYLVCIFITILNIYLKLNGNDNG